MTDHRKLAEDHWEFLEKWLHLIFVDGFVHGYKHGQEEEKQHNLSNFTSRNAKEMKS